MRYRCGLHRRRHLLWRRVYDAGLFDGRRLRRHRRLYGRFVFESRHLLGGVRERIPGMRCGRRLLRTGVHAEQRPRLPVRAEERHLFNER